MSNIFDVHVIRFICFILLSLPIAFSTIKYGRMPDKFNLIYLIGGISIYLYENNKHSSLQDAMQMIAVMALATIVMKGLIAIREIGGGAAKFIVATMPWFSTWDYVGMITVAGFLLVPELLIRGLIGRPARNGIQFTPRMIVVGSLILGSPVLGR